VPLIYRIAARSDKARSKNIATLRREGKPAKQAEAIAYAIQRKAMGGKTPKKTRRKARRVDKRPVSRETQPMAKDRKKSRRRRGRRSSSALAVRHASPIRHRRGRVGGGGGAGALIPQNMMGAFAGAVLLGVLEAKGVSIPTIGTLGEAGTLAAALYAVDRFGLYRSPLVRNAAIGLGSIAVYDAAKKLAGGASGGGAQPKTSGGHVATYEVR